MAVLRSVYNERVRSGLCGHCGEPGEPDPRGGVYSMCRRHRAAAILARRRHRAGQAIREYRCRNCRQQGHRRDACDVREEI